MTQLACTVHYTYAVPWSPCSLYRALTHYFHPGCRFSLHRATKGVLSALPFPAPYGESTTMSRKLSIKFLSPSMFTKFRHWLTCLEHDTFGDERGHSAFWAWTFCGLTLEYSIYD